MARLGKRRSSINLLPLILLLLVIAIVIFGFIQGLFSFRETISRRTEKTVYPIMWEEMRYSDIIISARSSLEEDSLDGESLFYYGASSYHMALSMVSLEEKFYFLDEAVRSLRMNLVHDQPLYLKETCYLLGKSYVHKGEYYSDLALEYLIKARELGYENSDLDEYIALAYSRMGDYENSLRQLELLAKRTPTAAVYLQIGEDAFNYGDYEKSRDGLNRAVELSQSEMVRLRSLRKLGELYFDIKNWAEAEKVLSQYLDIDYNNADIHFMLGEVYFYMGDAQAARTEWHRTERLDPTNRDALLRLYN